MPEMKPRNAIIHSENQETTLPLLTKEISKHGVKSVKMIEYAGQTVLPLIRKAASSNVKVSLLVCHPDCLSKRQRDRSLSVLDTIYNSIFFDNPDNIEVKCYKLPFGLRGRLIDDSCLELGWLTSDIQGKTAHGHDNPSLFVRSHDPTFRFHHLFFLRTFDDLWSNETTIDARNVLAESG